MSINDALLSYLEEYENSNSQNESNSSENNHSVLDAIKDLEDNKSEVVNITNKEQKIENDRFAQQDTAPAKQVDHRAAHEQQREILNREKKNTTFNFKLNITKTTPSKQESNSSFDILNDISSVAIESQPKPAVEHNQQELVEIEVNDPIENAHQSNGEGKNNESTLDKMEQLLAAAREKARKKAEEEENQFDQSSIVDQIHEIEGVTPKQDDEIEVEKQRIIPGKPKIDTPIHKDEENEDIPDVNELLARSETNYEDEWMQVYEKGMRSRKNNDFTNKVRKGRFRIDKNHQIEILSDLRTDNKDSYELLGEKWL